VLQLLVIFIVVLSSLIHSILMTEAIRSSKTSVLTRATRHHIPEDDIRFNSMGFFGGIDRNCWGDFTGKKHLS
jgi:hypothetical protein